MKGINISKASARVAHCAATMQTSTDQPVLFGAGSEHYHPV
jgi:hypothetical protein